MKKAKYLISIVAAVLVFSLLLSACIDVGSSSADPDDSTSSPTIEQPTAEIPQVSSDEPSQGNGGGNEVATPGYSQQEKASQPVEEQFYTTAPPVDSSFEVHFIDVGQGDSSLILCDG